MAQTLSNTKRAAINLMIQIGKKGFSFFDEGIVEGAGIWYDAMRDEMPVDRQLAARAITQNMKDGFLVKDTTGDNEDGPWVYLTEAGAKAALVLKDETPLEILAEEAKAPKAPRTITTVTGSGVCKCGCGVLVGGMGKALYRPGHDAKHVSILSQAIRSQSDGKVQTELITTAQKDLSPALFQKLLRAVTKR